MSKPVVLLLSAIVLLSSGGLFSAEEEKGFEPEVIVIKRRGFVRYGYFYRGEKLNRFWGLSELSELEKVIAPLGDEQAMNHLRKSRKFSYISKVCFPVSIGLIVYGSTMDGEANDDTEMALVISGFALLYGGYSLISAFSTDQKMKGVDRYNEVVREKRGVTFHYSPKNESYGLAFNMTY